MTAARTANKVGRIVLDERVGDREKAKVGRSLRLSRRTCERIQSSSRFLPFSAFPSAVLRPRPGLDGARQNVYDELQLMQNLLGYLR